METKLKLVLMASFQEKYFAKKAVVEFTPVLVHKSGEEKFKTIKVQGEKTQVVERLQYFLSREEALVMLTKFLTTIT